MSHTLSWKAVAAAATSKMADNRFDNKGNAESATGAATVQKKKGVVWNRMDKICLEWSQ